MLSMSLLILFTQGCIIHSSSTIVKFADDTTVVELKDPLQTGGPTSDRVVFGQQPGPKHHKN